jgi:hypothetical protein
MDGGVDHLFGDTQIAVMVDADLRDHIRRMTVTDQFVSYFYFTSHFISPILNSM